MAFIVPKSFLSDAFQDGQKINWINTHFNFVLQSILPGDTFDAASETKFMIFQKKGFTNSPHQYHPTEFGARPAPVAEDALVYALRGGISARFASPVTIAVSTIMASRGPEPWRSSRIGPISRISMKLPIRCSQLAWPRMWLARPT